MKKYRPHIILTKACSEEIVKINFNSSNIVLEVVPESTKRYWESLDGLGRMTSMSPKPDDIIRKEYVPRNELIIYAKDEEACQDYLSLIHAGIILAYPDPSVTLRSFYLNEFRDIKPYSPSVEIFGSYFKECDSVGFGCKVLQASLNDKEVAYALHKYKTSLELSSFTPKSADPLYGQVFENYDVKKESHTKAAFAIIAAFSVLEELGVEIRSNQKMPRFLDHNKGIWNPKVLEDIQARLAKIGVDDKMTIDWIYRGEKTEVEKEILPKFGMDSHWQLYHEQVRDQTLTFPEAIHIASFLRNKIAAHKFRNLTQFISPYDVFNVQSLARKIILEKMGLWNAYNN